MKYVKSRIEAVHFAKTNREAGIKILAKYLKQLRDRESLEQSYDISVADHMLPRKQFPFRAGIQTILDELAERNPKVRQVKPEDFIDIRFVQQLDDSGYIDQLYARKITRSQAGFSAALLCAIHISLNRSRSDNFLILLFENPDIVGKTNRPEFMTNLTYLLQVSKKSTR